VHAAPRGLVVTYWHLYCLVTLSYSSYVEIGRAPDVGMRERQQETRPDSDEGTYIADQGHVGFDRHAAAYPDGDRLPAETVPAACILALQVLEFLKGANKNNGRLTRFGVGRQTAKLHGK
jgi:hypothetical protein